MARVLIRQAHGGETRVIDDSALPYFVGYVIIDTLDDSGDEPPLYLSKAESDFRYLLRGETIETESADIADSTEVGRSVLTAADAAAARSAIGAATETLVQTTKPGTAYTFVLGDANSLVETSSGAAVTLTVPPNSAVAFPVGTSIVIRQYGAGQVTISPGAGVTLRSRGGALKTAGQYAEATLTQRAADEWVVTGDLTV